MKGHKPKNLHMLTCAAIKHLAPMHELFSGHASACMNNIIIMYTGCSVDPDLVSHVKCESLTQVPVARISSPFFESKVITRGKALTG